MPIPCLDRTATANPDSTLSKCHYHVLHFDRQGRARRDSEEFKQADEAFTIEVAQNFAAILDSEWPGTRLSYWHIQGRHEVDFVVEHGRETLAIEVKAGPRWNDRDLAGLKAFLDKSKQCRAAILAYGGQETLQLGERLWAVPLAAVLS